MAHPSPTGSGVGFARDGAGVLTCDGASLAGLAQTYGTPLYIYSESALTAAWGAFHSAVVGAVASQEAQALVCYSLKANPHLALVALLRGLGAGADLVSGGELVRAQAAGVAPDRMVFAGVAKSAQELRQGVEAQILQFNVESASELRSLQEIAAETGQKVAVALRYNPDVGGGGSDKITTGRAGDKFGLSRDTLLRLLAQADSFPALDFAGLSVHFGSQVADSESFRHAWGKLIDLFEEAHKLGTKSLRRADLGGGLGIAYGTTPAPSLEAYAEEVANFTSRFAPMVEATGNAPLILFEPGRRIVAAAGGLLTQVLRVKEDTGRKFILLDAAMNDLLRPALYGAEHRLEAVAPPANPPTDTGGLAGVMVAGPVCETSDVFLQTRPPAEAQGWGNLGEGDLAVFLDAGAYGATMASAYNSRPPAAEILVRADGSHQLITPRQTPKALMDREAIPTDLL